tara:strand:- start:140 stop:556 length:417 start_codon:yes stop_codon:yes gene_type:complete
MAFEDKDELIVSQVVFKGGCDLIAVGILELDELKSFKDKWVKELMTHKNTSVASEFPKQIYPPSNNQNRGGSPTDKQVNFIKKLIKEAPKSVSDPAQAKLDSGLSGKEASALIETLLEAKQNAEPKAKTNTDENEAPF